MYRVAQPENPDSTFEEKDKFEIAAKVRKVAAAR